MIMFKYLCTACLSNTEADHSYPVQEHAASLPLTLTGFASLAVSHVVEDVLHSATVGQVALPDFTIGLLPPLALVCMEQEDQLLLD